MNENQKPDRTNWREMRRYRAWELHQKGWKQKVIAEALGVTEGAVSQWLKKARLEGVDALRHRKGGGPKPRLKAAQIAQLPALLSPGAETYGFRGSVWTRKRVARVIQGKFGVSYSVSQVGRILATLGWSLQKPVERASQRDEAAIEGWRGETWQKLKKKPKTKGER